MKTIIKPIAIVPARKNSKRIKNKNTVDFFGKPLISRTLKNLINSKIFSKIYVSTDSKKIAEISKKSGAEVLYPRPKNLSNNNAILLDVMSYEVKKLQKKNIKMNEVFCILPTAIFIKKSDILKSILSDSTTDTIFTSFINFVNSSKRDVCFSSVFSNTNAKPVTFLLFK